jgi:hypothetical protein
VRSFGQQLDELGLEVTPLLAKHPARLEGHREAAGRAGRALEVERLDRHRDDAELFLQRVRGRVVPGAGDVEVGGTPRR